MRELINITLYTGPECSLCDLAEQVILEVNQQGGNINTTKTNIRDSADLYHLYGARIPVVKRHDNQAELGWPFDVDELQRFIQ
jgi:hypothetical protein